MKVIHILHELKFSGAEIMYVNAASVFLEKGCDLTVIATSEKLGEFAPYFVQAGYKVIHKPTPPARNYISRFKYYKKFVRFLKDESYNIVHIHSHQLMWGMALCAWLAGVKSVKTFHAIFPTSWYSYFYHIYLRWSVKNIFNCKFQSISDSVYNHELKLYRNKTVKIKNWYADNRYYPANIEEKNEIRKELNIPNNTLVFISIGGCDYNKRHHHIVESLKFAHKEIPNILYLHLGIGETEEEEKNLSKDIGISNYIRFYGNQENVRKFLIASDIYVMTSRFEGISITSIEAMACNIPTILYDVPGLRDFNKNGMNSILIQENPITLAEEIINLYLNPEKSEKMIENARIMVNKYYNMKMNASLIYELYL